MNRGISLAACILSMGLGVTAIAQQPEKAAPGGHTVQTASQSLHRAFPSNDRKPGAAVAQVLAERFGVGADDQLRFVRTDRDALGYAHERYQQYHAGYPVFGAIQKAHVLNGEIVSVNGHFVQGLAKPHVLLTEEAGRSLAVEASGAKRLLSATPGQDAYLQRITGKASATWAPKGELVYAPNTHPTLAGTHRLAWRYDIYSVEPLFRADIYVDAATGEVIWRNEQLHTADANGVGHTRFSGQQAIVTDSVGGYFRLREEGRADGVETYDMQNMSDYNQAIDVTQVDNVWDTFPTPAKRAALDAHWGAEMTYDYFMTFFNRNSYDDLGSKLISYVHFDNNYSNAFWNGQFMTYGDGGGNNNPFPGLDVCGHEFAHGVTQYAAGLVYAYEPGALNESFSDIFGNAIELWARPNDATWNIGDDIGAFRSMADPKVFFNPDTYLGTFWNSGGSDNGGVHTNSGVQNHWFYLLSVGGSGVNDNGDSYAISGLTIDTAAQIAYRNLSVYLNPNDGYAEARYYAIQSAIDLYGECSNAMIQTMNAWHAVGVGGRYTGVLEADFYTADSSTCLVPADVQFSNESTSGLSYLWDFGDGNTSTAENPSHTYTAAGDYTVTLIAYGCNGSSDTLIFPNRIHIDPQQPCAVNMPQGGDTLLQTGCDGFLYDSGGADDYLPNSFSRVTLDPVGNQQVMLVFSSFDFAAGDRITVFDGPSTTSPQIGVFAGTTIPGPFTSTNGALTIFESTNGANNHAGFEATWSCLVGANDALAASNCQLFPNPTDGRLELRWNRVGQENHAIIVLDALGRVVWSQQGSHDGAWNTMIDLSAFPKGVYTVHLQAGETQTVKKIIVQ